MHAHASLLLSIFFLPPPPYPRVPQPLIHSGFSLFSLWSFFFVFSSFFTIFSSFLSKTRCCGESAANTAKEQWRLLHAAMANGTGKKKRPRPLVTTLLYRSYAFRTRYLPRELLYAPRQPQRENKSGRLRSSGEPAWWRNWWGTWIRSYDRNAKDSEDLPRIALSIINQEIHRFSFLPLPAYAQRKRLSYRVLDALIVLTNASFPLPPARPLICCHSYCHNMSLR